MALPRIGQIAEELRQKPLLLYAAIVLATLAVYAPVQHHKFLLYDDRAYVTGNPHVNTGLSLANVIWAFSKFAEGNWHPLTWVSHMLDCQLFGLDAGAHHLVNVSLHAANAVLLFYLLYKLSGSTWRSLLVATLFAIHPLNVETVAWVAERKSLLCTFFSFLTLLAYGWYVRTPNAKRYLAVLGAFEMALLCKPMAVSIPLILLILDYWPLERYPERPFLHTRKALVLEKIPLFVLSAVASLITMAAQRPNSALFQLPGHLPLQYRLGNAVVSYATYIEKMLWPSSLAVLYPHPGRSLSPVRVMAALAILALITAVVLRIRYRARYLLAGWALFLVTLIPVIGIIQVGCQAMADRYAYFPCIGLFIMIAWGLGAIVGRFPKAAPLACLLAAVMLVGYAWTASQVLRYWQDGVQLFTRASEMAPKPSPYIEEFLAEELLLRGQVDSAIQRFTNSCEAFQQYDFCHVNLAEIFYSRYQLKEALDQYQMAAKVTTNTGLKLHCLVSSGEILLNAGQYPQADRVIANALQMDPRNTEALSLRNRLPAPKKMPPISRLPL